jgi:hypothetical protein
VRYSLAINFPNPPAASKVLPAVRSAILRVPMKKLTDAMSIPDTASNAPWNTETITSKIDARRSLREVIIDDMFGEVVCDLLVIENNVVAQC